MALQFSYCLSNTTQAPIFKHRRSSAAMFLGRPARPTLSPFRKPDLRSITGYCVDATDALDWQMPVKSSARAATLHPIYGHLVRSMSNKKLFTPPKSSPPRTSATLGQTSIPIPKSVVVSWSLFIHFCLGMIVATSNMQFLYTHWISSAQKLRSCPQSSHRMVTSYEQRDSHFEICLTTIVVKTVPICECTQRNQLCLQEQLSLFCCWLRRFPKVSSSFCRLFCWLRIIPLFGYLGGNDFRHLVISHGVWVNGYLGSSAFISFATIHRSAVYV